MIALIIFVALVLLLIANNTGSRSGSRKQTGRRESRIEKAEAFYKLQEAQRKREAQERKEAEARKRKYIKDLQKQQKEAEKEEKQRQKREEAEADIIFLQQQLETAGELLIEADNQLQAIEKQIEIDKDLRSYDSEKKHRKQKEAVQRKLIAAENRYYSLEKKAARARYIAG